MRKIILTLFIGTLLLSFISAEWIQKENIKYENIQTDENVQIEYDLQDNEFSFNLTAPTKFDLALSIEDNSNIIFERNKKGIFEDVKEEEIKFIPRMV